MTGLAMQEPSTTAASPPKVASLLRLLSANNLLLTWQSSMVVVCEPSISEAMPAANLWRLKMPPFTLRWRMVAPSSLMNGAQ